MINTLRQAFRMKIAYNVNSIIYAIKQIPIIKKALPDSLYSNPAIKILASVIFAFKEFVFAFLGKFLYFLLPIFLLLNTYKFSNKGELFLHFLFFFTIIGALLNTFLFNPSRDKYYAIILLRMNAREYTLVNYAYEMCKILIGFLIFGLIFGLLSGVPIYICILIPFFVMGLKAMLAAFNLHRYKKTGCATNENLPSTLIWVLIFILFVAIYGLPLANIVLPTFITLSLMIIVIIAGLFSAKAIIGFEHYREVYKQILQADLMQPSTAVAKLMRTRSDKLISTDVNITSNKFGFEYLNQLFVRRHRKLLWKSSQIFAIIIAVIICCLSLTLQGIPSLKSSLGDFISTRLSLIIFIMYVINRGTGFTNALFVNCDHSLLTYSFYKQPKAILKLFAIRLRELVVVNLVPASVVGAGLAWLFYQSTGTREVITYIMLVVSALALSVFFSVHYLTLYYLLQPYNASTEMQSATYQIASMATYFVCIFVIKIDLTVVAFGIYSIIFCFLYCLLAGTLVFFIAPKTFKLRA